CHPNEALMRFFSILTALLVAVCLYLLVFERAAILAFADGEGFGTGDISDTAPVAVEGERRVSVVTIHSTGEMIDSAVLLRGRTEAARQVTVSAETSGRIVSQPLRKGAFVAEGQLLCQLDPGTRAA